MERESVTITVKQIVQREKLQSTTDAPGKRQTDGLVNKDARRRTSSPGYSDDIDILLSEISRLLKTVFPPRQSHTHTRYTALKPKPASCSPSLARPRCGKLRY